MLIRGKKIAKVQTCAALSALLLAAPSSSELYLRQGSGYPVCKALLHTYQAMPLSTGLYAWPRFLPEGSVLRPPHWIADDPAKHRASLEQYLAQTDLNDSDQPINRRLHSGLRSQITKDIQSGKLVYETATITHVKIGVPSQSVEERPWTTDVKVVRFGRKEPTPGTFRSDHEIARDNIAWSFYVETFSSFPNVKGVPIELADNMVIVDGQPWFTAFGGTLFGFFYTNDLADNEPSARHRLIISTICLFVLPSFNLPHRR